MNGQTFPQNPSKRGKKRHPILCGCDTSEQVETSDVTRVEWGRVISLCRPYQVIRWEKAGISKGTFQHGNWFMITLCPSFVSPDFLSRYKVDVFNSSQRFQMVDDRTVI